MQVDNPVKRIIAVDVNVLNLKLNPSRENSFA